MPTITTTDAMALKLFRHYRPVARQFCWGGSFEGNVDLFLHSPGAVDEHIFYGVCIAHIHERV